MIWLSVYGLATPSRSPGTCEAPKLSTSTTTSYYMVWYVVQGSSFDADGRYEGVQAICRLARGYGQPRLLLSEVAQGQSC